MGMGRFAFKTKDTAQRFPSQHLQSMPLTHHALWAPYPLYGCFSRLFMHPTQKKRQDTPSPPRHPPYYFEQEHTAHKPMRTPLRRHPCRTSCCAWTPPCSALQPLPQATSPLFFLHLVHLRRTQATITSQCRSQEQPLPYFAAPRPRPFPPHPTLDVSCCCCCYYCCVSKRRIRGLGLQTGMMEPMRPLATSSCARPPDITRWKSPAGPGVICGQACVHGHAWTCGWVGMCVCAHARVQ